MAKVLEVETTSKKKPAPKCDLITITPQMAHDMLKRNPTNRPLKDYRVKKYMREIQAGNWEVNGETVKIDWNDNVMDAQHRLTAIKEAGVPVQTFVVTGLDPKTFHTIDTGFSRDPADVLHIRGEANIYVLASALRLLFLHDKMGGEWARSIKKGGISITEIEATLDAHPGIRDSIREVSPLSQHKIMQGSVAAALHYLFSKSSKKAANEFFDKLATGYDLGKGDPILTLRNTILDLVRSRSYTHQTHRLAITIIAWNAWRKGEKMQQVGWSFGDEFPAISK